MLCDCGVLLVLYLKQCPLTWMHNSAMEAHRSNDQTIAGIGSCSMCLCQIRCLIQAVTEPEPGAGPRAGIVDGMEGMVVGDERKIDTAFPQNWHEPESLRGVPCRCTIKVNELFEWDLPEARAARCHMSRAK